MMRVLTKICLATVLAGCGALGTAKEPPAAGQVGPVPSDARQAAANAPPDAPRPVRLYPGLTGYKRPVTTESADAQRWFDQGIQLLYGFNHDEAIRSFEKAAEIDPSCAMAWWGVAYARGLHINNPEMGELQSRLADEAATRAVAALDNESPVEQALVGAVRKRYAWPAPEDRSPLDRKYADAMEDVWHRFPQDADVGALFAESLMNLQPWDLWTGEARPKGRVLEILAVLERTLAGAPQHPGANHFYIHAIEASPWPERGTEAADRLRELIPGSGHLVHMPAHIYIRTGRYADAVAANQRAIAADQAYFAMAPPPEFYSVYFIHNLHFLAYAAMMEGRYQVALDAGRAIERQIPPEFLKKYVTIADGFMPTTLHVMIRFGKWEEILAEPEPESWRLFSRAERHFARSIAHANLGNVEDAEREIQAMVRLAQDLTADWKVGNNPASEVIDVALKMAQGELAFAKGERAEAFRLLRSAVRLEEALSYDEPPGWMQPVRHALGALLLADDRPMEAELVYRADLARHPRNAWSLLGLEQALQLQGKTSQALTARVRRAWARSDVSPAASCYCHPNARPPKDDPKRQESQ